MPNLKTRRYFRSREWLLQACALMKSGEFAQAGARMMKASQEPDFEDMIDDMDQDQQLLREQDQGQSPQDQQDQLATIVEGMADVNTIEDLTDEFPDTPDPDEEEVAVDAPRAAGEVDVDVADDVLEAAARADRVTAGTQGSSRLARAAFNARQLAKTRR